MKLKKFGPNVEGNDYVIGDVHGEWDKVEQALLDVKFDDDVDRLFCVGDLIDRGDKSEDSVRWLDKPWFHAVRGNHEQMAIDTFRDKFPDHAYAMNGGMWFLGLQTCEQQYYVDAFDAMPYAIEIETKNGRVGIVHAEVPDNDWANVEGDDVETMLWARSKLKYDDTEPVVGIDVVYVGHTVLDVPEVLGNVHYIDTGAVFGDRPLTIVKL